MLQPVNPFLLRAVSAACAALLAACGEASDWAPSMSGTRPNVVLIVVDTLRADHLSCYGHGNYTTPRLDELASQGVRYDRALSQAPWTTPSVASLMTSLYPTTTGIGSEREVLSDELTLLPELLSQAGYRTGAVISHTFCSARWNFDQGFDWFDQSNIGGHAVVTSEGVTNRALEFLDQVGEAPFFLWAHYFDPHFYYVEHEDYPFGGRGDYDGPVEPGIVFTELLDMRDELTAADAAELMRIYDSEIAHTDRWIGVLLDELRERGLFDRTLVVVTGDHGEEFLDHGDLGHARTLYQELINVPLLIKYPLDVSAVVPVARPGRVTEGHVALLDVFPTVLDVAGLSHLSPRGIEGRSLLRSVDRQRVIVSETARRGGAQSLVHGRFKLIRRVAQDELELYDVAEDRFERVDLARTYAAERERLARLLHEWERKVEVREAEELDLSAEDLEHLEQLGYAGADNDPD